jgi:hypothetical protein
MFHALPVWAADRTFTLADRKAVRAPSTANRGLIGALDPSYRLTDALTLDAVVFLAVAVRP